MANLHGTGKCLWARERQPLEMRAGSQTWAVARVRRRAIARFLAAGKAVVRTALAPTTDPSDSWTIKLAADALAEGRGLTFERSLARRNDFLAGLVERQVCACDVEHALALAPHLLACVWRLER